MPETVKIDTGFILRMLQDEMRKFVCILYILKTFFVDVDVKEKNSKCFGSIHDMYV